MRYRLHPDAKILLLDIETVPGLAYVWSLWGENVPLERLVEPSRVVCWAGAWLGQREIAFSAEWKEDRFIMLRRLWEMMDTADAIVTYNGDKFDLPKLHGEFLREGFKPPSQSASIDLYKVAKKLGYISNKLAFVAPHLGIGDKTKHEGFKLWSKVMEGDKLAQARMERYNKQDTRLLKNLYLRLRPYITTHPYLGLAAHGKLECPACGSKHVQSRGFRRTRSYLIQRLQCQEPSCGAWSSGKRTKVA